MSNIHEFEVLAVRLKFSSLWVICFVIAYVSSFILSGVSAPGPDLDLSYQAVLEYARVHNFQFGKDIVFTFGPLGFLNTWVSQGLFPAQRTIFALAWSGIVAWSATGLAKQIPGPMKFVFLVWFLIYSNLGWLEQHTFLVMAYGCMILMGDVQKKKSAAATFLTFFALLALIKFTFFMAAIFSIILCTFVHIGKGNYKYAITIILYFGAVFIALWMVNGQKIENLFPWIRASLEIAGGYTAAMTIFPIVKVLEISVIAGVIFLASLLIVIRSARLSLGSVGILLGTTGYVFLSWKHGFVRADGHVIFFIFFLPMAFAILLTETFQNGMNRKPQLCLSSLFIVVVILCNWAADFQEPGTMLTKLINWPSQMSRNSCLIFKSLKGDWKYCFEALQVDNQSKRSHSLPIVRSLVGKASIDVINYRQWAVLANDLNYRPRPVIQGYSAYTPYLQDLNLSFYRSEDRPQYLLFNMETIDNRFPTLDDATLLPFVLNNYKPLAKDGEFLVMKASTKIPSDGALILVHEQEVAFGEYIDLSAYNNSILIVKVNIRPTIFGRIVDFLFQSPELSLFIINNGNTVSYRFIPVMAERGFIISPLFLTNKNIMDYFDGANINGVTSILFSKPTYVCGLISNTINVRLYKQIGL